MDLNTPAVVLLTQNRTGTRSLEEAREAIKQLDYPAFGAHIPLRESVAAAFGRGGDLTELGSFYAPVLAELREALTAHTEGETLNV